MPETIAAKMTAQPPAETCTTDKIEQPATETTSAVNPGQSTAETATTDNRGQPDATTSAQATGQQQAAAISEAAAALPPPESIRYPLGYHDNPGRMSLFQRRQEGVTLHANELEWGDGKRKALGAITSITLRPYDQTGNEGPKWAACTIRFDDGNRVAISSYGLHGAITAERDAAYIAFVRDLHSRLDANTRRRIAFRDGITRTGRRELLSAFGLCFPGAILGVYVAFTSGPIYYLGITIFLGAAGAVLLIAGLKDLRSGIYDPGNLPAHALPPSSPQR